MMDNPATNDLNFLVSDFSVKDLKPGPVASTGNETDLLPLTQFQYNAQQATPTCFPPNDFAAFDALLQPTPVNTNNIHVVHPAMIKDQNYINMARDESLFDLLSNFSTPMQHADSAKAAATAATAVSIARQPQTDPFGPFQPDVRPLEPLRSAHKTPEFIHDDRSYFSDSSLSTRRTPDTAPSALSGPVLSTSSSAGTMSITAPDLSLGTPSAKTGEATSSLDMLWRKKYEQLCTYHDRHGHCHLMDTAGENRALAQWMKRQRSQFKLKCAGQPSTLTDERQSALEALGFRWAPRPSNWEDRYEELIQYERDNGHCNVPARYMDNRPLAIWVKSQRRQYKLMLQKRKSSMTAERVQRLQSVGFVWNLRKLSCS